MGTKYSPFDYYEWFECLEEYSSNESKRLAMIVIQHGGEPNVTTPAPATVEHSFAYLTDISGEELMAELLIISNDIKAMRKVLNRKIT
ncbi:hypothetical protein J1614_007031 [Plenodomus biglobosus]|nr:hypothetical protein J1614_007031 [Plenodomus biglobosus]